MKKIYLSVIGFAIICRLSAHAQFQHDSVRAKPVSLYTPVEQHDSSAYNPRRLRVDEVDFVSSYYNQNGDHSAVRGE